MGKWVKNYGVVFVLFVVFAAVMYYVTNQQTEVKKREGDIKDTQKLITDAKQTMNQVNKPFDEEKHQEKLNERTVSAKKIGQEIIAVDNTLTAFYKTADPLPKDESKKQAIFDQLEQAKKENTRLTDAGEHDHIKTWQLNPEWTLSLDSVAVYQDTDSVPVVFRMKTKAGVLAGFIVATYDVKQHKLRNVIRHYTTDGLKDEAEVGGI